MSSKGHRSIIIIQEKQKGKCDGKKTINENLSELKTTITKIQDVQRVSEKINSRRKNEKKQDKKEISNQQDQKTNLHIKEGT